MTSPSSEQWRALFEPRGVVVAGASSHPGKFGFVGLHNIVTSGYEGALYATNRDGESVLDVPTFNESGLPDYESTNWFGLMAPAKTPKETITRLNAESVKILAAPDVKDRFINDGLEPKGGTPEAFGIFIRTEIEKYAKVTKATGLQGKQ